MFYTFDITKFIFQKNSPVVLGQASQQGKDDAGLSSPEKPCKNCDRNWTQVLVLGGHDDVRDERVMTRRGWPRLPDSDQAVGLARPDRAQGAAGPSHVHTLLQSSPSCVVAPHILPRPSLYTQPPVLSFTSPVLSYRTMQPIPQVLQEHTQQDPYQDNSSAYSLSTVPDAPSSPTQRTALLASPTSSQVRYGAAPASRPSSKRLLLEATLKMAAMFIISTALLGLTLWLALPTLDEYVSVHSSSERNIA